MPAPTHKPGVGSPLRRHYMPHRRARTPSFWPPALLTAAATSGFLLLTHPGVLASVALGVVVGISFARIRWAIWRRRHPVVPLEVYITDLLNEKRRNARWN